MLLHIGIRMRVRGWSVGNTLSKLPRSNDEIRITSLHDAFFAPKRNNLSNKVVHGMNTLD